MEYRVRQRLWALSGRNDFQVCGKSLFMSGTRCFPAKQVQDGWADLRHVTYGPPPLTFHLHGALTSTAGQDHTSL